MKLGILCTMINGFGRRGYYNSQEIGLGRALVRMGHTVTIYKALKKAKGLKQEQAVPEAGLTICYFPVGGFGAHGYFDASHLSPELDGLLCFSDNQIFLPHIARWCKRHGVCFVPYVGTAHSLHDGLHGQLMDTLFALGTLRLYHHRTVIVKTAQARDELASLGVRDTVIAPVGLDTTPLRQDFARQDRVALRATFGFEPDDVVLCNVSRLESEKRPMDLVQILDHIRDQKKFRLLLIGEGVLLDEVKQQVHARGLEDRVKLIARVPYDEMWKMYCVSDYFVNLNKGEIFGMAIMEAVYYHVSVAAYTAPGPSLTLQGLAGHRLCASDAEIEQWLTSPYPTEAQLAESAEKLTRQFSWDHCAKAFASLVSKNKI